MNYSAITKKLQLQDSSKTSIMKNYIFLYSAILTIFSLKGYAQNSKFYVTDKINDKYAYVDVIKTYERVAGKGYK